MQVGGIEVLIAFLLLRPSRGKYFSHFGEYDRLKIPITSPIRQCPTF